MPADQGQGEKYTSYKHFDDSAIDRVKDEAQESQVRTHVQLRKRRLIGFWIFLPARSVHSYV